MSELPTVTIEQFGKDHWSLLAYVETLCVDSLKGGIGTIDKRRVRTNEKRHPMHAVNVTSVSWAPMWGTRLQGFFDKKNPKLQLSTHDDWDCLNDLEAANLIEVLSEVNGFVKLTARGLQVSAALRAHKATGGMFAGFKQAA